MFLRNIFEAIQRTGQGKTAVIGWGRGMGHKGHMMLASSVITQASKAGGDPYFVVSKTVGKDDPITPDEKIAIYKKVFPQQGHIFQPATDEIPDLTRVLANLNQQGYTSVTVVLGADQVKAFQYLKNYNNKPDKSGNILYSFDNLDVISRQETGDPSAGEEGPRATPMRQVLMDPTKSEQEQFAVWRDAMSPEIGDDEVRDLMMKAKERMTAMNAPKAKKAKAVAETDSPAMTHTAKSLENPPKVMQHRAKRDQERERQYMSTQIAKNDRTSKDEWGNLKELSNDTLGRYKKAASADASAADKAGDYARANKRFSGIVKATKKQFANDEKGVAEGAPIVVAQAPIDVRNPKKAAQPYRNQDDIVPDTKPPSTEKRGVKGRPGQRPMPQYDVEEGLGSKLAGLGLAGAMALGAGGAHARVSGDQDPGINRLTGKPNTTQVAPTDSKPAPEASKGFSKEYLQKAADPNRFGRYMISVEKAQELLMKMNAVDEAKKKGADGKACWDGYRYNGTKNGKDSCVKVSEEVENIMDVLINKIIVNEAIQNNRK